MLAGDGEHRVDALDRPIRCLGALDAGIALTAEHAADGPWAAKPTARADHLDLAIDGQFPRVGIRIGEVRGAAEHRHREAGAVDCVGDSVE